MTQQTTSHPVRGVIAMRGLTFRELGPMIGYHAVYLSEVVRGRQKPSPRLKNALADVLGVPVEMLFHDDVEPVAS